VALQEARTAIAIRIAVVIHGNDVIAALLPGEVHRKAPASAGSSGNNPVVGSERWSDIVLRGMDEP
jgi:hypothetical protein